jgi:hypothetical protein
MSARGPCQHCGDNTTTSTRFVIVIFVTSVTALALNNYSQVIASHVQNLLARPPMKRALNLHSTCVVPAPAQKLKSSPAQPPQPPAHAVY